MTVSDGPFQPTFDSLRGFECPDWFRDAKFGIWSHWGPQSVPMYGDWYARNLYIEGHEQHLHHRRQYGHPSEVGYKDIVGLWKAERFDPDALMDLYVAAGAKYFVGQAMHHDHFFNYDSAIHSWNSVRVGPGQDITARWKQAADRHGLPFGLTEHLGATFSWWRVNKGRDREGRYAGVPYDGTDPEHVSLYLDNAEHYDPDPEKTFSHLPWYTPNADWHRYWLEVITEVIDRYQPDLLYSDGPLPFGDHGYDEGLAAVAHLYNTSAAQHGGVNRAVYQQKDRDPEVYRVGLLDIERSQEPDIKPDPWQTDTSVGDWFYNVRDVYKTPQHVVELLVDIVAKNGNLLLNIPQRPDGTLDDECTHLMEQVGVWMGVNGEGIHGTRPFRVSGEGPSSVHIEGFREDAVDWTSEDFRFTVKGDVLYAFQLRAPADGRAVIRSLTPDERVSEVRVLGAGPDVEWTQFDGAVVVRLPERRTEVTGPIGLALTLAGR